MRIWRRFNMYQRVRYDLNQELSKIKEAGLFKEERLILSAQKPEILPQRR